MNLFGFIKGKNTLKICENLYFETEEIKLKKLFEYLDLNRPSKVIYVAFFNDMLSFYPSQENVFSFCACEIVDGKHDDFLSRLFLHNSCEVILAQHYPLYSLEKMLFDKLKKLSNKEHVLTSFVSMEDMILKNANSVKNQVEKVLSNWKSDSLRKKSESELDEIMEKIQKENDDKISIDLKALSIEEWYSTVKWK